MRHLGENIWSLRFPFRILGMDFGRVVTVFRLSSGKLVIHSTAPFSERDVAAIKELGKPGWLLDGTLLHDTFAKEGRDAFAGIPYLAPTGFEKASGVTTAPLTPTPAEWGSELEVIAIGGMPKTCPHIFFHRASRTLHVCDMFFNFPHARPILMRFMLRYLVGLPKLAGVGRFYRRLIKDHDAYIESTRPILDWDFQRMIVAHGEIVENNAKQILFEELTKHGLLPN
jgi:hypothetical protein